MTIDLSITAAVLIGVIWVSIFALLWRQTGAMHSMATLNFHRRDREQLEFSQLIQVLVEKLYQPDNLELAKRHAIERVHAKNLDAVERDGSLRTEERMAAIKAAAANAESGEQFCDPVDAVTPDD